MGTGTGDDAAGMLEGFGLVAVGVRGRVVVVEVVVGAKVTMAGMVFPRKRVIRDSNAMPLGSSWIVCTRCGLEQGVQESRLVRAHDTAVRLGVNSPPETSQGVK